MEINTYYYTLSTISQTLAAVLALAAVFVVLRLEGLNKNISDYKHRALNILKTKEKHLGTENGEGEDIGTILKNLKDFKSKYTDVYRKNSGIAQDVLNFSVNYYGFSTTNETAFVEDTYKKLDSFVSQRDGLMKLIKWPGIFTASAIGFSIISLGLSDKYNSFSFLLFIVGFALFAFYSVLRAAWKILSAIQRIE